MHRTPTLLRHRAHYFGTADAERRARSGRLPRKEADATLNQLGMGRNAPYAERLLFEVPPGGTEDLDTSMISGAILQQAAGKVKDVLTGSREEATDRRTGPGGTERP